jgi:hypothetical protein
MKKPGDITIRLEWLVIAAAAVWVIDTWWPARHAGIAPVAAVLNFWAQLGLIILSHFISAAFAPKQKSPEPQKAEIPDVKDGKRVIRVFGTRWLPNPVQLAMKQVGEDPIRKGGKK